jgi:uncharacterized protein (TIGR03437 family)
MLTGSVVASFSNGDSPLGLTSQQDGRWSATWAPRYAVSSTLQVTVTALQPDKKLLGTVALNGSVLANPEVPAVNVGGVVSSGSFTQLAGPPPGGLVSIFGANLADDTEVSSGLPLKTQMQNALFVLGGVPLPLVFTSKSQVNAILPYRLEPGATYQLIAQRGNRLSVPQSVSVAVSEPGIFTVDSSGKGQGHIYKYVDASTQILAGPETPVKAGDILIIYCAGLGPVDPPIDAGLAVTQLINTVNPVSLTIGGVMTQVLFSGLTPNFTGLYQVNAVVPEGITPGDAVPVVLAVANISGPPVTLAVHLREDVASAPSPLYTLHVQGWSGQVWATICSISRASFSNIAARVSAGAESVCRIASERLVSPRETVFASLSLIDLSIGAHPIPPKSRCARPRGSSHC